MVFKCVGPGLGLLVKIKSEGSLTSTCCKMLEHIIFKAIMTHLESNALLYKHQHGFRAGLSTVTQLAEFSNDIANILNERGQLDAIFLDFSKAYDVVPHQDLLTKLKAIGVEKKIVSWIECYLKGRKQYVALNEHISKPLDVLSGVPQGSVLAPILFLIYINDINFSVDSSITTRLFADDCVMYTAVNTEGQIKLNESLTSIQEWCKKWGMRLNKTKTFSITFTNKKNPLNFQYTIEDTEVPRVSHVKYLGVTFSSNLSWESHIDNICSKAVGKLNFLRRRLHQAPLMVKLNAYNL